MENEDLEDLQKQLLTCPVCLDEFHDDAQINALLPCLHSVCESCIPKIVKEGKLPCPICRMEHPAESFTTDNTTRDLADYVVVKKSPSVRCEGGGCDGNNYATHRCLPCGEFLCEECVDAHRRTTRTKNHKLIPMEELRDATDLNMFSHPQTCTTHNEKPLELYCNKKECQKPVCVTCAFVDHKSSDGHELVDINSVANQRRKEISGMIATTKEKSDLISKVTEVILLEREEIKNRGDQIYTEIEAITNVLHNLIDRMKENLMEIAAKQVKQKTESLERQESKLKDLKNIMEHAILYSSKAVCYSSVPAFLQLDRTIADRLQSLNQEPFDKEPWEISAFGLNCHGVSTEVQNALTQKMHVWSSAIYPPNTKIQSTVAIAGEQMVFKVELRTADDQPVVEDAHFKAMVTDPQGDISTANIKDGGLHNGTFAVTYTPMVCGIHMLELTILNQKFASHRFTVEYDVLEEDSGARARKRNSRERDSGSYRRRPSLPQNMISGNPDIFSTLRQIMFYLDKETAHKEVAVSDDGTAFTNVQQGAIPKTSEQPVNRHKKFKGARGTHVFSKPGKYFYEVILEMQVVAPLEKNNIAFEVGIARLRSIDNKKYIEGQEFAWSMIGAHHPACDSVCIHVVRDRKVLLHKTLVKNEVDQRCRIVLGFLLDTDNQIWEIYNSETGEKFCVVQDVNCDEPLFPVVSGYNASQIQVTATFVTGHENLPRED